MDATEAHVLAKETAQSIEGLLQQSLEPLVKCAQSIQDVEGLINLWNACNDFEMALRAVKNRLGAKLPSDAGQQDMSEYEL